MDHQRAAVRAELHLIVDRLVNDWEWIDSLSGHVRAIGGGGEGGSSGKGSHADPTLDAVLAGDVAGKWLDGFRDIRVRLRVLDTQRAKMAPTPPKRGRENTVDVCVRCEKPAPKVHRIDGHPYCATTCYFKEWRARRASA